MGVRFRGDLQAPVPVVSAELEASRVDSCYSVCSCGFQLDQHCRLSRLAQKAPKELFFSPFLLRSFKLATMLKNMFVCFFISFQLPLGRVMKDTFGKCHLKPMKRWFNHLLYIGYAKRENEELFQGPEFSSYFNSKLYTHIFPKKRALNHKSWSHWWRSPWSASC